MQNATSVIQCALRRHLESKRQQQKTVIKQLRAIRIQVWWRRIKASKLKSVSLNNRHQTAILIQRLLRSFLTKRRICKILLKQRLSCLDSSLQSLRESRERKALELMIPMLRRNVQVNKIKRRILELVGQEIKKIFI